MIDLDKARTCACQAKCHLIWATKYRRKVLDGSFRVRLEKLSKMIVEQNGFFLLAARVHDDDHVLVFVCAPPSVSIPEIVRFFKCISAKVLFEEIAGLKLRLWGWLFVV